MASSEGSDNSEKIRKIIKKQSAPKLTQPLAYVEEDSDSDSIDEEEVDTIYDPSVVKKDYVPFSVAYRESTAHLQSLI